jgi:hypothetical protein
LKENILTEIKHSPSENQTAILGAYCKNDIATVAALGCIAALFTIENHELGHAFFAHLYGAKHFFLALYMDSTPEPTGIGARWEAAGGTIVNMLQGSIAYLLFRALRNKVSVITAYFLWLFSTLNFLMSPSYLFWSAATGNGDWAAFISGWPHHALFNAFMGIFGLIVFLLFTRFLAYDLATFSDNLLVLTLVPYFSSIVIASTSSLISPLGLPMTLIGALPATSIGFGSLSFMAPWARRLRGDRVPIGNISRSGLILLLGFISALIFLYIGRGVTWSTN